MNWEPMTEDAVFEEEQEYLMNHQDMGWMVAQYFGQDDECEEGFYYGVQCSFPRHHFTHFCRITNPNEVTP